METEGIELWLCPYCDGTPTLEQSSIEKLYIHCARCELDFGHGKWPTKEQLAKEWNEWVKTEMRAQDFAAKKLGDVLNGHGTTVPVDWDRLGNTAAFDVVGGDSNRVDAPVDGDPTLEGEMHTVLRKMANIFITDPDELHDFYENIESIIAKLKADKDE